MIGYVVVEGLELVVVLDAVAEADQAGSQVMRDEGEVLGGGGEQAGELEDLRQRVFELVESYRVHKLFFRVTLKK